MLLTVLWLGICLLAIRKWKFFRSSGLSFRELSGIFIVKVAVGVALWAIYTYHYTYRETSDAFRYFDDAMVICDLLWTEPLHFFRFMLGFDLDQPEMAEYFLQMRGWTKSYSYGIINDNPTIIRINTLIGLVSFGHYHVHTVILCFISFLGGTALFKGFRKAAKLPKWVGLFATFLIPGVLFWSSGVLKEAPLMCLLGFLFYHLVQWVTTHKIQHAFCALIFAMVMLFVKGYVVLLLSPAILSVLVFGWVKKRVVWTFLAVHILIGTLAIVGALGSSGDFFYVLNKKQQDFVNVAEMQNAGSAIPALTTQSTGDIILALPVALYRTYLRPDIRDLDGVFQVFGFMENLLFLGLILLMIIYFRRPEKERWTWILFSLSVVLAIGFVIGWVVPVLGAIVRYKVPVLPFLACMIFLMTDFDRIWRRFGKKVD